MQKGKPAVSWMALGLHVPSDLKEEESLSTIHYVEANQWELCCLLGWPPLLGSDFSFKTCCSALWTLMFENWKSLFFPGGMTTCHAGTGYWCKDPPRTWAACIVMQAFGNIRTDKAHDPDGTPEQGVLLEAQLSTWHRVVTRSGAFIAGSWILLGVQESGSCYEKCHSCLRLFSFLNKYSDWL